MTQPTTIDHLTARPAMTLIQSARFTKERGALVLLYRNQAELKKQGKEKKPDTNRVSLVSPG